MKRCLDLVLSSIACVVLSPLVILVALAMKCCSPGPLLYKSRRVGQYRRPIECWKFRTMHQGADAILSKLLAENPELQREWDTHYKLKHDPRVHPLGRILRTTSLDELPQLWNVLKGDLSLVGPRPVTEAEVERYFRDKADKILSVRPGLTGIWQTSGRSLLTFEERVRLEESYVDSGCLALDLKILGKTCIHLLFPKGAW